MPKSNGKTPEHNYDPRWFIWTIIFLVSTGILLVTYIVVSDNNDVSGIVRPAVHKATASR